MSRNAVARKRWKCGVVALSAVAALACNDAARRGASDGGLPPPADAASDADVEDSGAHDGGDATDPPMSRWDGGFDPGLIGEELCILRVAAQCDGAEDCPLPGGGIGACCARFEPSEVSYTAIECAAQCDFERTFPLCHANQRCTRDNSLVCRTSLLIPHDFIGVCAPPNQFSDAPTGRDIEGIIECGDEQCVVGKEQCCLREGFDFTRLRSTEYEPYCAPIGQPCDCGEEIPPRDDAGMSEADAGL